MLKKKKRAPRNQKTVEILFASALVVLWTWVIFSYSTQPDIAPQIVYGAPFIETEAETEVVESECLYSEDDLYRLSHLIAGEVNDCDWEMKIAVGSVVLNRIADPRFPSTLGDVIFQPGQYSCTWDGNYDKVPNEETVEAAKFLLENGSQLPPNVIFQAEFVQGTGIYEMLVAPNGVTEYFCYG